MLNRQAVAVELLESGARDVARALGVERRDVEVTVAVDAEGRLAPKIGVAEGALGERMSKEEAGARLITLYRALKGELNERLEGALQRRPGCA